MELTAYEVEGDSKCIVNYVQYVQFGWFAYVHADYHTDKLQIGDTQLQVPSPTHIARKTTFGGFYRLLKTLKSQTINYR